MVSPLCLPLASGVGLILFLCNVDASLLDACCLTSELTQVVELGATYLTVLVDLNRVNVRRLDGEDTLNTDGT